MICNEIDQWCVNLPGSYYCCSKNSNNPLCKNLNISFALNINENVTSFLTSNGTISNSASAAAQATAIGQNSQFLQNSVASQDNAISAEESDANEFSKSISKTSELNNLK